MKIKIIFLSLFVFTGLVFGGISIFARENGGKIIPGQYIVVFKDNVKDTDVDSVISDLSKKHGTENLHSYHRVMKGFAGGISLKEVEKIKRDPRVDFVSEDREVEALGKFESLKQSLSAKSQSIPTGIQRIGAISSLNKGAGIVVAVIDTGIDQTHPDLSANILNSGTSCIRRTTSNDDNGHGTHVSGTIAAIDNGIGVIGVAPKAKLIPVKVLDRNGGGTWSSVICGIDWVTSHAGQYNIKLANLSLGGGGTSDDNCGNTNNDALHRAICRSRDAGITYVVAAGNSAKDSASSVPAAYDDAVITISALADSDGLSGGLGGATPYGPDDTFANFSNFGAVVDLGAPGVSILSTWRGGGYATISGTSMATPHVVGAAVLYLNAHPGSTWTQIRDGLKSIGELLGGGHSDPSLKHPEPVLKVSTL